MKRHLPFYPINASKFTVQNCFILLLTVFGLQFANAQLVSQNYSFSQASGAPVTYTDITGGAVIPGSQIPGFINVTGPTIASATLPFDFFYNNARITEVSVFDNGYIIMGIANLPTINTANPLNGGQTHPGAIAGLATGLSGSLDPATPCEVRYETIGTSPNQIFVVQYKNLRRSQISFNVDGAVGSTNLINMQIRLYEGTSLIEVLYRDQFSSTVTTASSAGIGLRGAANTDFNNRLNVSPGVIWPTPSTTTLGTLASSTVALSGLAAAPFINSGFRALTRLRWTPCFRPTGVTAVLQGNETLEINWTLPNLTSVDWEVRTVGNPGSGSTGLFASGNTSTLSTVLVPNLILGTTYFFYYKSACSTNWLPTNTAPSALFVTPVCLAATLPYTQNFEFLTTPNIPSCNSIVTPSGAAFLTVNNTGTPLFGFANKNLSTQGNNLQNSWYFTQQINLPVGSYRLSYKYGGTREQIFFTQRMRVSYGTVASVAGMTTILEDHPDIKNSPLTNVINFNVTAAGDYFIGFYGYAAGANGFLQLDDIVVEVATCRPPTALVAGQVASFSAAISWTPPTIPPSGGYSYFLSTAATPPVNTTVPTGTTSAGTTVVSLAGLNPSTTYNFWVRSNCGAGELSVWSSVISFATLPPPPPPPPVCTPLQSGGSQVSSVRFNTINNSVVQSAPFYDDYPVTGATTTSVRVTQTYPLQVTTAGSSIVSVWIDYDKDGTFAASEWTQVWTSAASGSVNITIPLAAVGGLTRMRVRSRAAGSANAATDACTAFFSGSTHDYTIFIDNVPPPVLTISGTSVLICSGATSANVNITSPLANFNVYSWNPSTGVTLVSPGVYNFNPTTTTAYTLTGQLTSGSFDSNTAVYNVSVTQTPTPIILTPAAPVICQNATTAQLLSATGGIVSGAIVPGVSEDFNSGPGGYSTVNNSTLGTVGPSVAAWTLRNSPYTTVTAIQTLRSNDNSQFYTTDSDWQGSGGLTRTELISPPFDLTTYSDASLSFWHYYRSFSNGFGKVQISVNSAPYIDLIEYTNVDAGGAASFANQVLSLNAYAGFANLRLRFIFSTNYGWRWSVDNVVVSGTNTSAITWSPTTNLFNDAAGLVPYLGTQQSSVFVKTTGTAPLSITANVTSAGCIATATVPITVNSGGIPSANQTVSCVTLPAPLTLSGFTGTVTRWQSSSSPTFATGIVNIVGSNSATLTAAQIGTLPATRYFRAEVDYGTCFAYSPIVTITITSTTWSGSTWSNGTPSNAVNAVFLTSFTSSVNAAPSGDISACNVVVTSGTILFNRGTLTVQRTVAVNGGSLIFDDVTSPVSLFQPNNATNGAGVYSGGNTGNITFRRTSAAMFRFDYTYWSSPVFPQNLYAMSPNSPFGLFLSFSNGWQYINPATTTMLPARGYAVRAPLSFNISPGMFSYYSAPFIGIPNSGDINIGILGDPAQFNLLGNPYPSALFADDFIAANPNVNGTLYFWTHNSQGTSPFQYTDTDYASYTLTGGTGTSAATTTGAGNNTIPTGFIASGQGFFVKGLTSGTAVYTNAMRRAGNNAQFFRTSAPQGLEKNRYWLNMSNAEGAFKQALVGYIETATMGVDRLFDGELFEAGNPISLYTKVGETNLSIQGRALPFDSADTVPLSYKTTTAGTYTISIPEYDGLFTAQQVYLQDNVLNIIHDLTNSDYTFTTEIGTVEDRFVLRYTNQALSNPAVVFNENSVVVYKNEQGLFINTGSEIMKTVTVFDISGRQIAAQKQVNSTATVFNSLPTTQQVLLVKIEGINGGIVTKKIVF